MKDRAESLNPKCISERALSFKRSISNNLSPLQKGRTYLSAIADCLM